MRQLCGARAPYRPVLGALDQLDGSRFPPLLNDSPDVIDGAIAILSVHFGMLFACASTDLSGSIRADGQTTAALFEGIGDQ